MPRAHLAIPSAALLLILGALPALAQDKGTVAGRVTDRKTGHAIPFANVTITEARRGVLTDSEGQYVFSGIPAGLYEIKLQFLGYKPESRAGVKIEAGKSVTVDFQLQDIVVREEKAVEVTAERRLVEVRQGTTIRSVNASDIRNLPVQTVTDVLQQQAGINTEADQIHVRGGRSDETVFVVNGVANRDLVTGGSTAGQLNARSVAEVNVATGAYDVRYGNALSGVVEITLKEGGDKLVGGITLNTATYGGRQFQFVLGGPDPLWNRLGLPGAVSSILDVSGTLFETRFRFREPGAGGVWNTMFEPVFNTSPYPRLRSSYEDSFFGYRFRYGNFFTPSQDNRWALRYGLTWKPQAHDKLNFNFSKRIAIDQGFSRTSITARGDVGDPVYPWQWAHRISHAGTIFEDNVQSSLEWKHVLSTQGYTSLQFSRYFFAQRQDVMGKPWGQHDQPPWEQYDQPEDFTAFDTLDARRTDYFLDTGDDNKWQDRRTTTYALAGSVVQRARHHEVEFGFEHQFQSVQYVTVEDPWIADPNGLGDSHDLWLVHPWVGDLYARDRLEYEGFTGNLGVRADYWFMGQEADQAVSDPGNPNVTPETRTRYFEETHGFFGRRYKVKISPRVIVAHPITENSSFFFNYGHFTQNPSYRYVYSKLKSISSESFPLLGNPNLNPQVSINYELGAKDQFLPRAAVNLTFFVKDIYDYPASSLFKPLEGRNLTPIFVYLNGHFARSRGFEVEFEKRRSNHWSGKLAYTYQQTRGKSSDPNEQKVVQEGGGDASETPLGETFVDWNRPHKLSANFDLRFENDAPERWSFLEHTGMNVYIQGISGRAYTPSNPLAQQAAEPNSKNGPFQMTTDVRVNHSVHIGRRLVDVSLAGLNVFSAHIINRVDPVTGLGRVWGVGSYDPELFPGVRNNLYTKQKEVDDPSNYGPGVQWRLQLDYDF